MLSSDHPPCSTWNVQPAMVEPNITGFAAAPGTRRVRNGAALASPLTRQAGRAQYTGAGSLSAELEPHAEGRLNKCEAALAARTCYDARPEVRVKLLPEDGDFYAYVESQVRIGKERSMRRKRFKRRWARLGSRSRRANGPPSRPC
jgi:hypothetical protein